MGKGIPDMQKRTIIIILVLVVVAVFAAKAQASEQAQIRFATGTFAIDHTTCKFVHKEADQPLGRSWLEGRVAFAYEDGRHDALDNCLRNHISKPTIPPPPDTCWTAPPTVAEAPADKQGYHDTRGLVALQAWAASLAACEASRNAS